MHKRGELGAVTQLIDRRKRPVDRRPVICRWCGREYRGWENLHRHVPPAPPRLADAASHLGIRTVALAQGIREGRVAAERGAGRCWSRTRRSGGFGGTGPGAALTAAL